MKKSPAIVAMICLILVAALGGTLALNTIRNPWEQTAAAPEKQENPIPVDTKSLDNVGLEPFVSNLPVMMIDTRKQQIMKDSTVWADVAIMDSDSGQNDIMGMVDSVLVATVKYRGASSYSSFDKPQYRITFYRKENGKALDYDLFGLGADSEWVLNGPFLDRTLLRNYLVYTLSGEIMEWAPGCTFFELFVNGKYQGVYLAVEPVTNGASRLRLSEFGLLSGATAYIVKRDRVGTELNVLHTYGERNGYTSQELSVGYPGKNDLTKEQFTWIERDISQFEQALYSESFADPDIGYSRYIDVNSFVDYFIINEFAMNHDASVLSTYVYKELGGKTQLCVWDFNNGFDNYQWFTMDSQEFYVVETNWFDRLLQDRNFVEKVEQRYQELRRTTLSDEHIAEVLTHGREMLGPAVERNFAKWGYTFEVMYLAPEFRDPQNYEQAITQLETVIAERLAFLDTNMHSLEDGCIN